MFKKPDKSTYCVNLFIYICLKCKLIYNDRNDRLVVSWEEGGVKKTIKEYKDIGGLIDGSLVLIKWRWFSWVSSYIKIGQTV